ncbi:hypothetical protein [Epilithonimonas hominis]|uniref:hypothetical protein n=1 Tax=Epilithonimonas hominis TaxID=420404 RepID=UPI000ED171F6|nr:hypothetical protein [Epilithonimonas hominis]HAP95093.1 hypothetical protein [Chryseobacterium sp.]
MLSNPLRYLLSNGRAALAVCRKPPLRGQLTTNGFAKELRFRGRITFIFQLIFGLINLSGSVDDLGFIFHFLPFGSPIVEKKQLSMLLSS